MLELGLLVVKVLQVEARSHFPMQAKPILANHDTATRLAKTLALRADLLSSSFPYTSISALGYFAD